MECKETPMCELHTRREFDYRDRIARLNDRIVEYCNYSDKLMNRVKQYEFKFRMAIVALSVTYVLILWECFRKGATQ